MCNFPFEKVEGVLGYTFQNKQLLYTAFVHSSFANENKVAGNERMEFFGDAILQYITTEQLMDLYKDKDEGDLSKIRSAIVSMESLTKVVDKLGIEDFVLMSNGQKKIGKPKKLESNLYEAILCAIYLDGGMDEAKKFVLATLSQQFMQAPKVIDFATELKEYCEANKLVLEYKFLGESGEKNDVLYQYQLYIDGKLVSTAQARKKKSAQHKCAEIALTKLNYKK